MRAARALLSDPQGSPEHACGLLQRWVAAWAAASKGTLSMLARSRPRTTSSTSPHSTHRVASCFTSCLMQLSSSWYSSRRPAARTSWTAGLRRLSLGHARDREPERASGGTFGWQLLAAGVQPRRGGGISDGAPRGHRGAECCRGRSRAAVKATVHPLGHTARRSGALLPRREQLQQKPARGVLRHAEDEQEREQTSR